MVRRKGERPIPKQLAEWGPAHPVARMIRTGDRWFTAWSQQTCTPLAKLEGLTGIPRLRLLAIEQGSDVSRAEVDALARAWCVSGASLMDSIADAVSVID